MNTNVKERIRVTKDGEIEITCPNCNLSKIFSIKKYIKHSKTVRVRIRCKCGFTKWAYPFPSKVAHQKIQSDKGFRDFHWGDEISSMPPDFEIISDESYGDPGCVTVGRLKNEKLAIGDIKITSIKYYFFNNQLGRIYIQGDWKYYDLIKVLLSQKYGEPKTLTYVENPMLRSILGKSMVRSNSISWMDGEVHINLLEWFQETFGITYLYDPLKKKFDECEQVSKQRENKELEQKAIERKNHLKKKYKNEIDEL